MTAITDPPSTQQALLEDAGDRNQQWRVETLLLCNWGGFGGANQVNLDPDSSLISGATGAGKSTILDAYTCLLHPNKPLNSASNQEGAKTRGEGIRTPLTYVRGVYDHIEHADESMRALVLRGGDEDTWSAIAAVFASTSGARFTALRLFYAPREAVRPGDVKKWFATFEGRVTKQHLDDHFDGLAERMFRKDLVEKALPGLRMRSVTEYCGQVQQRLSIGSERDGGDKALRLLYDLQAGVPVESVDGLFKRLVLAKPDTFGVADSVITSFDSLDRMHQEMLEKEEQTAILAGIEDDHQRIVDAQDEIARIDTLRLNDPARSPFALWAAARKDALYDAEKVRLDLAQGAAEEEAGRLTRRSTDLESQITQARREWEQERGTEVDGIDSHLDRLTERLAQVRRNRDLYKAATRDVSLPTPSSADDLTTAKATAQEFIDQHDAELARLRTQLNENVLAHGQAKSRRDAAESEVKDLAARQGNIEGPRHKVRLEFARLAGLSPEDLPFVGELVDMKEQHEGWRKAADAVLGALANTLLVDENKRHLLRSAIDHAEVPIRIQYKGVTIWQEPGKVPRDDSTLAARLEVKEGPFGGWLRSHLDRRFAYECVETPDQLGDDSTPRVTRTGQTQAGRDGAHGGHGRRHIGFSNEEQRRELLQEIADLGPKIADLAQQNEQLHESMMKLGRQKHGHEHILSTSWADLDQSGVEADIAERTTARDSIMNASDKLSAIKEHLAHLNQSQQKVYEAIGKQNALIEEYEERRGDLATEVDAFRLRLWAMQDDDAITVTGAQQVALDQQLADSSWDGTLSEFDIYCRLEAQEKGILARELQKDQTVAGFTLGAAIGALTSAFKRFHDRWPDPNRGTSVESYDSYLAILTDLREQGLGRQREKWARQVIEWGGEDLMDLYNAYDNTLHKITERLLPIRRILSGIPFTDDTTLSIDSTPRTPSTVASFKNDLRALASGSMDPRTSIEQVESKFGSIRETIARVRRSSDERDLLLDVRRHLKVTASATDGDGLKVRTYDSLHGKSGGQTQTLTAFIAGAALRFHLGDEDRDRPRFTPVVLDEAFIKADVRHASLGVVAWRRLGFQLIIGAPEGQFTALERAVGQVIGVMKDAAEHSYVVPLDREGA